MGHTLNSPSSLSRREKCPASMMIEAGLERGYDKYSDSGTLCHKAVEAILLGSQMPNLTDEEYALVNNAMAALSSVMAGDAIIPGTMKTLSGADVLIEVRFDDLPYSIPGLPERGTCDLAIVYPDHILLVDWKFGGSFVDHPKWNRQLQAYALGLWQRFPGREIHVVAIQPRATSEHQVEPWIYAPEQMSQLTDELNKILLNCHMKSEVFCVGNACQFCSGARKNKCPARLSSLNMFAMMQDLTLSELDSVTRARILTAARAAKQSADRIIDEARDMIRETGEVPEGYRASRTSKDNVRIDANPNCPSWPIDWRKTDSSITENLDFSTL